MEHDGIGVIHPLTRAELREWLAASHESVRRVWLASWKKKTGKPRIEYEELVEELLCFGWIDSRAGTLDDDRSILLLTPRNPKSGWSRPNKERVERLERAGLALTGVIASSDDDWDRYESLHWRAVEEWLAEHPDDPIAPEFRHRQESYRRDYIRTQRSSLGWAIFVGRKG